MLSRSAQIRYQWQRISLTDEEMEKAMKKLLDHNFKEFNRIADFLSEKGLSHKENPEILKILAEKQLASSFTVMANAIDEKVFEAKQRSNKPVSKTEAEKIKKVIDNQLGKTEETPQETQG
jgi:hypothetical protein